MSKAVNNAVRVDRSEDYRFTIYADFNCPFCFALNERMHQMGLAGRLDFRPIQHDPEADSGRENIAVLADLTGEIAELRRRLPSVEIDVPLMRPNSEAASILCAAMQESDPELAAELRLRIYRALWREGRDISDPDQLAAIVSELETSRSIDHERGRTRHRAWQQAWEADTDYHRTVPVVVSRQAETLVGLPLKTELDSFLLTGSTAGEAPASAEGEREPLQRILVLDRDFDNARQIVEQMREAQVEVVQDFSGLMASALNQGVPDLVVVDTELIGGVSDTNWWHDADGPEVRYSVPVVFVSSSPDIDIEVAAFEAGAADFIRRPCHPRILQARLSMHLRARRAQQELDSIARIDSLTTLCNRREFDFRLLSEWGRGARSGSWLSLIMIDVDQFKDYNDHLGHLRGDDCLVAVAQLLKQCVQRSGDLIARYGGEEFVALLPEADLEGAALVAERCRDQVEQARIPHVTSNVSPYVTVSIGVTAVIPEYDSSANLLVEQADSALYHAKQQGRNRVCRYDARVKSRSG